MLREYILTMMAYSVCCQPKDYLLAKGTAKFDEADMLCRKTPGTQEAKVAKQCEPNNLALVKNIWDFNTQFVWINYTTNPCQMSCPALDIYQQSQVLLACRQCLESHEVLCETTKQISSGGTRIVVQNQSSDKTCNPDWIREGKYEIKVILKSFKFQDALIYCVRTFGATLLDLKYTYNTSFIRSLNIPSIQPFYWISVREPSDPSHPVSLLTNGTTVRRADSELGGTICQRVFKSTTTLSTSTTTTTSTSTSTTTTTQTTSTTSKTTTPTTSTVTTTTPTTTTSTTPPTTTRSTSTTQPTTSTTTKTTTKTTIPSTASTTPTTVTTTSTTTSTTTTASTPTTLSTTTTMTPPTTTTTTEQTTSTIEPTTTSMTTSTFTRTTTTQTSSTMPTTSSVTAHTTNSTTSRTTTLSATQPTAFTNATTSLSRPKSTPTNQTTASPTAYTTTATSTTSASTTRVTTTISAPYQNTYISASDINWIRYKYSEYCVNRNNLTFTESQKFCREKFNATLVFFYQTGMYVRIVKERILNVSSGSFWVSSNSKYNSSICFNVDVKNYNATLHAFNVNCTIRMGSICGRAVRHNSTEDLFREVMNDPEFIKMIQEMTVKKNSTGKSQRRLISVRDKGAQQAGTTVSIVLFVCSFAFFMLCDVPRIKNALKKEDRRKKSKERRRSRKESEAEFNSLPSNGLYKCAKKGKL